MYQRILVGYDGSKCGRAALERAAVAAKHYSAQLTALWLVFYSKIAPWLENLQQQAIFDGAFFQTSKCSDKF
jgi:nucleotide-binding universal stress UspA family protein